MPRKPHKTYALYRGDRFLAVGTLREIAEESGLAESTIKNFKTPWHNSLMARQPYEKRWILIEVE